MNTSLYNLPKDILIKLISIIRENTIKEYKDVVENELNDCKKKLEAYKEYYGCDMLRKCNYKNGQCNLAKYVHPNEGTCEKCDLLYCDNHMYGISSNKYVCEECYDK